MFFFSSSFSPFLFGTTDGNRNLNIEIAVGRCDLNKVQENHNCNDNGNVAKQWLCMCVIVFKVHLIAVFCKQH